MAFTSNQKTGITRTERGLVVAGTRITLYQFMDYLHAGISPQSFRHNFLQITDEQFDAAISYIEENRHAIEAEYQIIVKEDEENRQYWEQQNRERCARIAKLPPPPGREAAWAKLQEQRARFESPL
jgi:uncharacterized protein (DUF433 family)